MVTTFNEQVKCQKGAEFSGTVTLPACITTSNIATPLAANVLRHEVQYSYAQAGTVAAATAYSGVVFTVGYVREIKASLVTACTTTDTVTVQVAYHNGTTWVNLLASAISFSNADAALLVKTGTLTTPGATAITANAPLRWTITASGTSAANLVVTAIVDQAANS